MRKHLMMLKDMEIVCLLVCLLLLLSLFAVAQDDIFLKRKYKYNKKIGFFGEQIYF